jgi:hypothetical protein
LHFNYDIIPDIHGQHEKLAKLLCKLGWFKKNRAWKHSDNHRKIIFLGDFIDRGTANKTVISIVRNMVDADNAIALMGNHELNAIYFHSFNKLTGRPLRKHDFKNIEQHKTFLNEFPLDNRDTKDIINWFCSLPLVAEFNSFRTVHACWSQKAITLLQNINRDTIFSRDFYTQAKAQKSEEYFAVELLTKGPEQRLPLEYFFTDKTGLTRNSIRLAWWRHKALTWRELAVSVPNVNTLPEIKFDNWEKIELYPKYEIPVFFGHYWMSYPPLISTSNAICLDCSAGGSGPLVSYHFDETTPHIKMDNITSHITTS